MSAQTTEPDDAPTGDNSEHLAQLAELLDTAGLALPFSPPELTLELAETAPRVFSSRPALDSLYGLTKLAAIWRRERPIAPLFAVGFDGYGAASRNFQCALAGSALAMAFERPFGNFYADIGEERRPVVELLTAMANLYETSGGGAALPGRPGKSWMIVQTARTPLWLEIADDGTETPLDSTNPLADALALLNK